MKLHYYPETDSLYIELKATPSAETREVPLGLNVDLDAAGNVVGRPYSHHPGQNPSSNTSSSVHGHVSGNVDPASPVSAIASRRAAR